MPKLVFLTRQEIKDLVRVALKSVGDVATGMDIETITFEGWSTHHKRIFAITLVDSMLRKNYDVFLTEDKFARFATIADLIDYVEANQAIRTEPLSDAF